ncbi:solute carrier family member 38 [Cystoisospora suis]|uniref:Solute carrier family member 38 n=1 Tax=Cystoisospora suis TaxID=483139 RepID=A0A2C6L171_9APIC|nr:solute carrier family member 38 [Cystoisospora suis]
MVGQSLAASSQERVQRSGGASLLGRLLSPPCGSSLSSSYLCSSSAFPPPPHLLSFGVCPGHRRNHASFPEFSSSSGLSPASSPSHPSRESLGCSSRPGFDRRHPVCGKPRSRGVRGRSCSSMSFPSVNGCPPVSLPLSQYIFSPALPRASSPVSPFGLPVDSSQMKNRALSPSCFSRSALSLFSSCPSPCPRRSHVSSSASSSYHRGHCCCCYVGAASMCSPRCFPLRKSVVSSFSPCRSHACHSLDVASCTSSLPDEVSRGASTAVKAKADEASRAKKARVDSGVAGALSGIACATILQPLDVIKTQQQQQQAPGTRHNPPSVGQICKRIYTMWGWRGFWRGLWPCLLRVGPGVGIYFYSLDFLTGSWKFVAAAAKKANAVSRLEEPSLVPSDGHNGSAQGSDREAGSLPLSNAVQKAEEETKAPPWYNAVVSAVARGVAVLVFNPISVIKTRVESSWVGLPQDLASPVSTFS